VTEHKSRSDTFTLYPIGDIHLGAKGCEVDTLRATIEKVRADRNARWCGMGDYAEHIVPSDKRFDQRSVDPRYGNDLHDIPGACVRDLIEMFRPIRDKCLGLITGNHEETLRLRDGHNVQAALVYGLGAKDLGYDAIIRWTFRRNAGTYQKAVARTIKILISHGTIAGRKDGGKINRMADVASNFNVDLALFGHGHSKIMSERIELDVPDQGEMRLIERRKTSVMCGTYRRSHTVGTLDYGEKGGFAPVAIGSPRILIHPHAKNSRDLYQVIL
jgi:hypothetical protein